MQRILLVDIDRDRRSRVTFLLQHMGYAVDVYPCGGDVPEPDLVLVSEQALNLHADWVAPWMLRAFGVPKLIMGTEPEEVAGVPYLEIGADAYLPAPLDLRMLLARVRALLNRRESLEYSACEYAEAGSVPARKGRSAVGREEAM